MQVARQDLQGAVVIVTGASSGIGAATARTLAGAGASVVLTSRSEAQLTQLAAELPGEPLVVAADLGDEDGARGLVDRVLAAHGRVDVLINNAGVGLASPVETLTREDVERAFAVNLLAPLTTIQAVIPSMRQRQSGHIINVSSVVGIAALPYAGGYAATKAALDRLTEALRIELRGSGIAVTLVRPGTTRTDFGTRRLGHPDRLHRQRVPRGVSAERVARVIHRATLRRPRVAYVTFQDRVLVLLAMLAPPLVDRVLSHSFRWEGESHGDNHGHSGEEHTRSQRDERD
jgi:short-subunit dehydrogenase